MDHYKKFLKIEYGEPSPEVAGVKILDEPLKAPDEFTPEWRKWITEQQDRNLKAMHAVDPIKNVKVKDMSICEDGYEIQVRIYTPLGEGPFPVFVYIHGGAWVFCDVNTHDHDCRYLCVHANHIVISVDYHLAPEYKFPHQIKEGMAVLKWVTKHAGEIGGCPDRIVVGGDSAGGNISAGLCIYNRDHENIEISKQVLIYPAADLSGRTYYSHERYGSGYGLESSETQKFVRAYVDNEVDLKSPYASPILCEDLKGLPPTVFVSGECDVLVDESLVYAQRLHEAGVEVKCFVYRGMPHGFIQAVYKEAYQALDVICAEIQSK